MTDEMPQTSDQSRFPIRFTPEITLGQVLQAVIVAGGLTWGVTTYQAAQKSALETAQINIVDLNKKIDGVKTDLTAKIDDVKTAIQNLPDIRATLPQLEKRMDQFEARSGAQSDRLLETEQKGSKDRSDIDGILRVLAGRQK